MAGRQHAASSPRSWIWWAVFVVLSVGCGKFAVDLFPSAFPMANLSISMQRAEALAQARLLSKEHKWEPHGGEDFRQAATFASSEDVQNFFELEEGLQAWQRLLVGTYASGGAAAKQTLFYPYTWNVRHFREGHVRETFLSFGPDGRPCGFEQRLPEDEEGVTVDHDEAREIAESTARAEPWGVEFGLFDRAESSHLKHLGGRTDHTFTYERKGLRLGKEGEGRFLLTLVVSGDELTQLSYSVKIPEAFERRFAEMRSYNNTIATVASIAMAVLFVIIGYGMGLFYLMRQRWVIWKPALAAGVFVGFLLLLSSVNEYPMMWMEYDTAESASTFVLTNVLGSLAVFVGASFWFFLSYMAAESLTRRAFPEHPQVWRLWEAAHTPAIIGRVVSGYMLVSVFFAYEVGLYFFCQRKLGWWVPSSVHEHPDVLATYLPWVSSIALSLQAGSWEECCFRAVPLSLAALVGRRFNRRGLCVALMMVVQAVVFGAAHANYPSMPSWARLVELVIPSLMFGGIYLRYGLVPSIVLHFVFDVVWFALPLFASPSVPDQVMVILLASAPLWLVLAKWALSNRASSATKTPLNKDWHPPKVAEKGAGERAVPKRKVERVRVTATAVALLALLALAGLGTWVYGHVPPTCDSPTLDVTRDQAIALARSELLKRYGAVDSAAIRNVVDNWYVVASVVEGDCGEEEGNFVWETEGGREGFARVVAAGYLEPPHWRVRFVQFDIHEPNVTKRAERYAVSIKQSVVDNNTEAAVHRVLHRLAESSHGASLPKEAAEQKARQHAARLLGLAGDFKEAQQLVLVSSSSEKMPNRVDWRFTFADRRWPLEQGESRLEVELSGAEITNHRQHVHVPEEWRRERQNAGATIDVVRSVCSALLILCFVVAFLVALVQWSTRGAIDFVTFKRAYALLLVVFLLSWLNNYPTVVEDKLVTSQPFYNQVTVRAGVSLLKAVTLPFVLALVLAHFHHFHATFDPSSVLDLGSAPSKVVVGLALGTIWAGFNYGGRRLTLHLLGMDDSSPSCPSFSSLAAYVPPVDIALASLRSFFTTALVFFVLTSAADRLYLAPGRRHALVLLLLLFFAFLAGGAALEGASMESDATDLVRDWALPSLLLGIALFGFYVAVLSKDRTLVPSLVAVLSLFDVGKEALWPAFPGVPLGFGLSAVLIGLLVLAWTYSLQPALAKKRSPKSD